MFTSKWNVHLFSYIEIRVFPLFLKLVIKTFSFFAQWSFFIILFELFLSRDSLNSSVFILSETLSCLMVDSLIYFSSFRKETSHRSLMVLACHITFVSSSPCSTTPPFINFITVCYYVLLLFFLDGIEIFWLINCFMCWFVANKRLLWREVVRILLFSVFTLGLNLMYYNFFLLKEFF